MLKPFLAVCIAASVFNLNCMADEQVLTEEAAPVDPQEQQVEIRVTETVTVDDDGDAEPRSTVTGRIVIVGPDGKVREYSLDDEMPEGARVLIRSNPGKSTDEHEENVFIFDADHEESKERLMIGVHCDAADEILRVHLKLGDAGLVVRDVIDDSPAAESGLQKGDILVEANGSALNAVGQLVGTVNESEGQEINFGVIHLGDRKNVSVKPRKMKTAHRIVVNGAADIAGETDGEHPRIVWRQRLEGMDVRQEVLDAIEKGESGLRVRSLLPGIVIDRKAAKDDIRKLIVEVRERGELLREQRDAAQELLDDANVHARRQSETESGKSSSGRIEELQTQVKQLQEHMAALQKKLDQFTKTEKE